MFHTFCRVGAGRCMHGPAMGATDGPNVAFIRPPSRKAITRTP
jgi:hypothetical protein